MRNRARAFTLFEVLLVITLLGLLAALVWPDFAASRRSAELDESALRFKALLGMCRAQAMNESRRYRIVFHTDGTIEVRRQLDPLVAPHVYVPARAPWARTDVLQESVWVESLLLLPEGPPPLLVEDETIEFVEFDEEPQRVEEREADFELDFSPDGVSPSLRWVVRASDGRGVRLTLDGRLGRLEIVPTERLEQDARRPEPRPVKDDESAGMSEAELLEQYAERRP